MRNRGLSILPGILIIAFILITIHSALAPQPGSVAKAQTLVTSVPALSPTPTATSTSSFADQLNQNFINPTQAFVNLIATLLTIVLAIVIVIRILAVISSSNKDNLVIETFTNSTGNTDLDKVLPGLTQRTREILTHEIEGVREQTKAHKDLFPKSDQQPDKQLDKAPISQDELDGQLTNLLKSLQDIATGQVKTVVQLIGLAFPPRGTKVITILNNIGEMSTQPGMSIEVTDMQDAQKPTLYTIGEPVDTSTATPTTQTGDSGQRQNKTIHSPSLQPVENVVKPTRSPGEDKPDLQVIEGRFIKLQRPVARWLAIELIRRSMVTYADRNPKKIHRDIYNARLFNFTGAFHQASATCEPAPYYSFFYGLAIHDFKQAISISPTWYQPYKNAGDTHTMQAGIEHQNDAIFYYQSALNYLYTTIPGLAEESPEERKQIELRIRVGKAHAQLEIAMQKGGDELKTQATQALAEVEKGWVSTSELDSHILYNLACCHALLGDKITARRYLTYSLARNDNLFTSAQGDSELKGVTDGLNELHNKLKLKIQLDPELQKSIDTNFSKEINEVLIEAGWAS